MIKGDKQIVLINFTMLSILLVPISICAMFKEFLNKKKVERV